MRHYCTRVEPGFFKGLHLDKPRVLVRLSCRPPRVNAINFLFITFLVNLVAVEGLHKNKATSETCKEFKSEARKVERRLGP